MRGAFSLVLLDERRVIGVRDPHGFRPLVIGRLPAPRRPGDRDDARASGRTTRAGWSIASETAGLDVVGAEVVRDVEPGEIVVLEPGQEPRSVRYAEANPALCVFELIYFARPDSYMEGRNLYQVRLRMGMELAREHPVDADLVMPVPGHRRSGRGRVTRRRAGIPYREGMVRNRYTGRTFIQPSQAMRQRGVSVKLRPLREVVRGQRLVVVDDSIVRGTTTQQIVASLRKAGAREVHVRIPPRRSTTRASTASTPRSRRSSSRRPTRSRRSGASSAPTRWATCRSGASSRRWTCRTSGSASHASTALPGARPVRRRRTQVHARGVAGAR